MKEDPRYVTPKRDYSGVRSFGWKDIAVFALVLITFNFVAQHQAETQANGLRDDINRYVSAECIKAGQAGIIGIYNGFVDTLLDDYNLRRKENLERGDKAKADINQLTITGLRNAKIPEIPVNCADPILPRR